MILNQSTLTLYLIAAGLCLCLSLVTAGFNHLQSGSGLMKSMSQALGIFAAAFVIAGFGPVLPWYMTILVSNLALLSAGAVMYSGFSAFTQRRAAVTDRFGLTVVALTVLPFWYWGAVEPDGNYRSAVYSFAAALINGRAAWVLWRFSLQHRRNAALWFLTLLLGAATAWMCARGVLMTMAQTQPVRAANPTSWLMVFWFIVVISAVTICVIRLDYKMHGAERRGGEAGLGTRPALADRFSSKLLMLWSTVLVVVVGTVGEVSVFYTSAFDSEQERLTRISELSNEAFAHHSLQLVSQADTLLQAVRSFHQHTQSASVTARFIESLPFDRSTIDNVYLIDAQGKFIVAHDSGAGGVSVADRDYFSALKQASGDPIFIGTVESGRVTGKLHFRVVRRISGSDGSLAGLVVATVDPQSFSEFYRELARGSQNIAALIGTVDKKLRARYPAPETGRWATPVESPLWPALESSPRGSYRGSSAPDGIERHFHYARVGDLPLVMVTGFSQSDIRDGALARVRWVALGSLAALLVVMILAVLLTVEIRRLNEHERFMSMLNHELKTPLSVLRMTLGLEGALSPRARLRAQQSVQDVDAIVERCLQADRMGQRRHADARQPCQLGEMLAELQMANADGQRLVIAAQGLHAFVTDTQLLRIALGNLIDNALKYSPSESLVHISAMSVTQTRRDGILVSVSNTPGSAGLPDPAKVFTKYYRSAGAHARTGSGLGLFLVRTVAQRLGGSVRYVPSDGAVQFEFWIPV